MDDSELFRWAWLAARIQQGQHIDDYRQTYAERAAPLRHRQRALVYMTKHLIEIDRLVDILADHKRLLH